MTNRPSKSKHVAAAALAVLLLSGCDPEYDQFVREQKELDFSRAVEESRRSCVKNGGTFTSSMDVNFRFLFPTGSAKTQCVFPPQSKEGK